MLHETIPSLDTNLGRLVEPDRVHKAVYTDPQLFELEMQRIHERHCPDGMAASSSYWSRADRSRKKSSALSKSNTT